MAKPLQLSQYPFEYFQVIEVAYKQGYSVEGAPADLMNLRFELYAFRKALRREAHSHRTFADPLKFYLQEQDDGTMRLVIMRSDQGSLARLAAEGLVGFKQPLFGQRPPGMDSAPTEAVTNPSALQPLSKEEIEALQKPQPSAVDTALEKLFKWGKK